VREANASIERSAHCALLHHSPETDQSAAVFASPLSDSHPEPPWPMRSVERIIGHAVRREASKATDLGL
jgi:hypothetical protein